MKKYTILFIFILTAFKISAQDSIAKKRFKINEFNLFVSKPIIFSTQENGVQLIRSSIKDESLIDNEINNGFSDTVTGSFYRGARHYFPVLFNTNVGFKAILYLPKTQDKKCKFYIPVTFLYERLHYTNLTLGIKNAKRLDTLMISDKTYYLDSTDIRKVSYRNYSNRIFVQSGINMETGNKGLKFSMGINIGLGLSFLNKIDIYKEQRLYTGTTVYTQKYQDNEIYRDTESKTVKGKTSVITRVLVPICLRFQPKKSPHFGIMAELNPGFELNTFIHKAPVFSRLIYTSLGLRYSI